MPEPIPLVPRPSAVEPTLAEDGADAPRSTDERGQSPASAPAQSPSRRAVEVPAARESPGRAPEPHESATQRDPLDPVSRVPTASASTPPRRTAPTSTQRLESPRPIALSPLLASPSSTPLLLARSQDTLRSSDFLRAQTDSATPQSTSADRSIEFSLSAKQGWDIKLDGTDGAVSPSDWTVSAERTEGEAFKVRVSQSETADPDQAVAVTLSIQSVVGESGITVNGENNGVVTTTRKSRLLPSHPISEKRSTSRSASPSRPPSILSDLAKARTVSTTSSSPRNVPLISHPPASPAATSTRLASLLRRNYTYMAALLQEPERKWRALSDSHGTTVTQLNSIDPTLTIYRAEGTFVGVGIWDVYSTICTPGARMHWDKNLEEAILLDDVDLLRLWHLKTKGAWPVAPRDSVTIQMAYQSPSSVHVLAFSTDDTHLFPSIPAVVAPTIRSQIDLYGWVVEALSPTTTRITLIDQSDPKGWSNKSWTPSQMVSAVAGVGDFSIKYGGPPIVTSLLGAKATLSTYEHSKRTFKTEYRATPPVDPMDFTKPQSTTIECKLRCDCNVWSTSLVIIVDPPPSRVTCTSRHRLSEGGGTWITIEHDRATVGEERVMVVVRKGGEGSQKGSCMVNGTNILVDVETLPEDEIEQLSTRKRVKHIPVPLDFPNAWTAESRSSPSQSGRSSPLAVPRRESLKVAPPIAASLNFPESLPTVALVVPAGTILHKPPLEPPGQAFRALSWLQTFHAEQGPELTEPAPGWAIVSERGGVVVRKKLVPGVSDVLPVYRGDKIVQGLSADEIAGVVSAVNCRSAWDERVETAIPLAAYGHGISTAALTTKATFPFKGRLFHVASANAQFRIPSASADSSTSTILFVASASFPANARFDAAKINPAGLLPGEVLLEGWILETLDPYTSSMLAIPSTRCTYISCVDHSSYVPLAFNSVLNANLVKIINSVENLAKKAGPLPTLRSPEGALQIEGPLSDDGDQDCVWQLSNVDSRSVLLSADFSAKDATYRSLYQISAKPSVLPSAPSNLALSRPAKHSNGLPSVAAAVGSILKSELPRSASLTFAPPAVGPSLQKPSTAELTRKASLNSLRPVEARSKSPPAAPKLAEDLVVAELVIDLKQYPHGYSIACSSSLITPDMQPLSLEPLISLAARHIPLFATAHDAPLPAIVSASLNSWKRQNHLVRILVPTPGIVPLGLADPKPMLPNWYRGLVDAGAVVDVRIIPLPEDGKASPTDKTRVMFNGEKLVVLSQKESRAVLARFEEDEWQSNAVKISRIPRKRTISVGGQTDSDLPLNLRAPIAVAVRLLAAAVEPHIEEREFPDPKSPGSVTPADDMAGSRSPVITSRVPSGTREPERVEASTSTPLLGILGSYPLPNLASSFTTTSPVTDDPTTSARRTYTITFVVLVAVISFLLGSFLRSLLTPADFIITSYGKDAGRSEVERALLQAFDPAHRWREAVRLLELPALLTGWDVVLAAVRR